MESGSVGGYIIKKIIEAQERQMTYVFDGLKRPSALRDSVLDNIGVCHQKSFSYVCAVDAANSRGRAWND